MVTISLAKENELAEVLALYQEVGYGGGVSAADKTLIARIDHRLIAAVRLCLEEGVTILRGMQVHPDVQRQQIGSLLLRECIPHLNEHDAFCLPYSHLQSFYQQAGFEFAPTEDIPLFLCERLAGYTTSGRSVIAMQRPASKQPAAL